MASKGGPRIIPRAEWGARASKQAASSMKGAANFVFIHHSAGPNCCDREGCAQQVRAFQKYHMDDKKWDDIGYSFVVGEDGEVYMGRGWTAVGAHTKGFNSEGIGICIIGNYNDRIPNNAALDAVKRLIQSGVDLSYISPAYTLKGHRDVGHTDCPGHELYALIRTWPRYAAGDKRYG